MLLSTPGIRVDHRTFNRAKMADDKDPFKQMKDLNQLKNQLEEIQKRVESEFAEGIPQLFPVLPQGGSVLASPFLKGFLAGYMVAKLRSSALIGVLLGTFTGIYAAQNYQVPNIESTLKDYMSLFRKGPK
ncbi:SLC35A4 upstream open reading frame protein-like isoform X1 [Oncorhynchus masou masou]|uniref:SLC35A4 upstream open reading frame protein-like isoform X1 n=1 Tax=Oncorhynchus masou masou TaxID=90313 RepID=UPI003183C0D6